MKNLRVLLLAELAALVSSAGHLIWFSIWYDHVGWAVSLLVLEHLLVFAIAVASQSGGK